MGNSLERLAGYDDSATESNDDNTESRKRRSTDVNETPPKKITKLDTAKYVYERLFLQGEGSDVAVHAVGHVWHLHKLYLQQCKYFEESVLERCGDAMAENILPTNVLRYLNLAEMYGLPQVMNRAYHLLKWNFWRIMKSREHLKDLKEDTFIRLISSSELLIMEGEMDIYQMIKAWIFLREKPHATALPDNDFMRQMNEAIASYPPGELFVYSCLILCLTNLQNGFPASISVVESDRVNELSIDDFHVNSLRLGRLIDSMPKCWRWTGFNNGVDIVMNMSHGVLTMKRNCLSQATPYSINLKSERVVHYRVIISDGNGACLFDSTKQVITLRLDQVCLSISVIFWGYHLFPQ
ncbi:unnamed protein product [Heligmosomoides polygyrus]|uniref:BACK domain-containing protein n=1 Tax=Heligmosomoides polygyrus TaxID=6339 RepID=A0A183GJA6_HELPZ|nr:unnamed protein product [Heligmosomoides polygyrus]